MAAGTIYLLHFDQPYAHARHYLGATGLPLEERLAAHSGETIHEGDRNYGRPAKLLVAAKAAGVTWRLADVWECEDRAQAFELEKRLKAGGSRARLCSICNPGNNRGAGLRDAHNPNGRRGLVDGNVLPRQWNEKRRRWEFEISAGNWVSRQYVSKLRDRLKQQSGGGENVIPGAEG